MDITELFKTQISLTEWLEQLGHGESAAFREEDNEKRERLRVLNSVISLPFDKPHQFSAAEIVEQTPAFRRFLTEHGNEKCAMRLIPLDPALPKLRMRGHTIRDVVARWFPEQHVDPAKYRVDFVQHPERHRWSTIFIVNRHGVVGEIIAGGHQQLTQGFYDEGTPIAFSYDFRSWRLRPENPEAQHHLKELFALLQVPLEKQNVLQKALNATFIQNTLCGYFETVCSEEFGTTFIDYNRWLGKLYQDFWIYLQQHEGKSLLTGQTGSAGKASGSVRLLRQHGDSTEQFKDREVLVCAMTTPRLLPLMQKASAIVTDFGGMLSHAAIAARELGKPCIVGTRYATTVLKTGQQVEVDADSGQVWEAT